MAWGSGQEGGKVHPRPCSDLATQLGLHLPGPSEESSWDASGSSSQGGEGSIWVWLSPPRACSTWAPTLCVSTCGACEHLTVSHAWSPGQEARDLGPGNDPRMSPKSFPTCCRAFSTLFPNLPRKTFLTASDSLSARVFLRLQPVLSVLLEDVSSHWPSPT